MHDEIYDDIDNLHGDYFERKAEKEYEDKLDAEMDENILAKLMLEWREALQTLSDLEARIVPAVLERGKSITVGDVRAAYSNPRKSYDWQLSALKAGVSEEALIRHTQSIVDWEGVAKKLNPLPELVLEYTDYETNWKAVCQIDKIEPSFTITKEASVKIKLIR